MPFVVELTCDPAKPSTTCDTRPERPTGSGTYVFSTVRRPSATSARRRGGWVTVGDVSLHKKCRSSFAKRLGLGEQAVADVDIIALALERIGTEAISYLQGEFAFVAWNEQATQAIAARDRIGIRHCYFRQTQTGVAFASELPWLNPAGDLDLEFVAEYLVKGGSLDRTIWKQCRPLKAGMWQSWDHQGLREHRYWELPCPTPTDIGIGDARAEFTRLLKESLSESVHGANVWCELSGGLDSSTIVCLSQRMSALGELPSRLSGTVTHYDPELGGLDPALSEMVATEAKVDNIRLRVPDLWTHDRSIGAPVPQPHVPSLEKYSRLWAFLDARGCDVLLSGVGGDECFTWSLMHLGDWAYQGRLLKAAAETVRWSAACGHSVWSTAWAYVLKPVFWGPRPADLARGIPEWVRPEFAAEFELRDMVFELLGGGAPNGKRYGWAAAACYRWAPMYFEHPPAQYRLQLKYPFFYLPLIEFCLSLPPELRHAAGTTKWLLREAMKGVLPERVRSRGTKDGIDGRIQISIHRQRAQLEQMVQASPLVEYGVLDPCTLISAIRKAALGSVPNHALLLFTLSLETWLADAQWSLSASVGKHTA